MRKSNLKQVKVCAVFMLFLAGFFFAAPSADAGYIYTGGALSGSADESGYYVDIAPLIGYRYRIFDLGFSPFYSYSDRNEREEYTYGKRTFVQAAIYRNIYAHAELQVTNIETSGDDRKWVVSFPLGAGYRYELSPRATAYGMVLYDLAIDDDSPAMNPIFRTGVTYRF